MVQSKSLFWVKVDSATVKDASRLTTPPSSSQLSIVSQITSSSSLIGQQQEQTTPASLPIGPQRDGPSEQTATLVQSPATITATPTQFTSAAATAAATASVYGTSNNTKPPEITSVNFTISSSLNFDNSSLAEKADDLLDYITTHVSSRNSVQKSM